MFEDAERRRKTAVQVTGGSTFRTFGTHSPYSEKELEKPSNYFPTGALFPHYETKFTFKTQIILIQ